MKKSIYALLAVMLAACAAAQDGVSTASAARTKYLGNLGALPTSREIAVEEFVNYHRHELPRPKAGSAVAMDVRWTRDGRDAILQVGLATSLANDRQHLRPINLSLVIDTSGSMAAQDKLERVKQALLTLVTQLRPTDTLSLVSFDSSARVLVPAQRLNRESVQEVIRGLVPGSSTNIEAGLILGYKEALKNYDKKATNRVILLTDGIANVGVTDPAKIAEGSLGYNDRGIDLSTIGVGEDLNKDLLRSLAKSGRGLFHFVADNDDIKKVFVSEMQSLVSPVASDPDLVIEYDSKLQLDKVFGYEPKIGKNTVRIRLDNMNSGMTEVVLLRFRPEGSGKVTARLTYQDIERGKPVTLTDGAVLQSGERDSSVGKNYSIALLAQSIKDMAAHCEGNRNREALAVLNTSVSRTQRLYPNLEDADIRRNLDMAVKYRNLLREQLPSEDRHINADHVIRDVTHGPNLVSNGDFSQGNTGFVAHGEYIKPSVNCLWGGYYTVVPAFNSPAQLHTNVASLPFAAPGGGNVLFMNTGAVGQFVLYSTVVKVKPHTKYRISFQEIGLSGGPEWTNSYEIRVDKDRSEAQIGGTGQYVEVFYEWNSGTSTTATLSIVRLPKTHIGGVIGIANIEMVKVAR